MNFPLNWRDRRNLLAPPHYHFANYCTDIKNEMKNTFGDELFLNNLYLGPDPLRKNLADTIITEEKMATKNIKNKLEKEKETILEENIQMQADYSPLSGITNFFSGVLNVISNAMFKRKHDDFSYNSNSEMAVPSLWHGAKITDENKILRDEISNGNREIFTSEMSDCRSAAAHCQSKLDQVRALLGSSKPMPCSLRARRCPKRVFVDINDVDDCFEDAFSPEDFENLANDSCIEYISPMHCQELEFYEVDGPKVKIKTVDIPDTSEILTEPHKFHLESSKCFTAIENLHKAPEKVIATPTLDEFPKMVAKDQLVESTEIVKNLPEVNITNTDLDMDAKNELIESCEDKITKLKLLLQERRKNPKTVIQPLSEVEPENPSPLTKLEPNYLATLPPRPKSSKIKDKHYKNPNRRNIKRKKSKMRQNIDEDMFFANEINTDELSSVENSPSMNNMEYMRFQQPAPRYQQSPQKEYFDEVSGRFHSSSVDSDDSFQIVFNDSPKIRRQSDCDSEDSFIIFEDSPDSCYTSNDVFGDTSDSGECDSDSDLSDSGCGVFKLSASLSKSFSNLADESLYEDHNEDEVDNVNVQNLAVCDSVCTGSTVDTCDSKGLLLNERKKFMRKNLPVKRVHFSTEPPKVHVMRVWLFAAKQTRMRYWEQFVVDRERFKRRIDDVDMAVSWVLKPQHRSRIMFQRFMPWWNAQKRQEIAEKKEREVQEEEKLKLEVIEGMDTENNQINEDHEEERLRNEIETECTELNNEADHNIESTSTYIAQVKTDNADNLVKSEIDNEESQAQGEERIGDDSIANKDIDNQNSKRNTASKMKERENNNYIDNMKNSNISCDKKAYDSQMVPYNEKILDLKQENVSSILDT